MRVFDFGANWHEFSAERVDAARLAIASQSLQALLQRPNLNGLTILDVGCGSGLFSIAAAQLGAEKVMGVDVNPRCIAVSQSNHQRLIQQARVTFRQASALNVSEMEALGKFDIVYAWGSLHHSGAMWQAISNVAKQVAPGGMLVLAIYNKHITSPIWTWIKWLYNQLPGFGKQMMAFIFALIIYIAKFLVTRRNPLEKERGMDFWYDVVDWVGGYPYEYATLQEVTAYMAEQGFTLRRSVPAQVPTGCNEFVFEHLSH
jgi:2-polyprenyl-6-hydroxyphenyl methylase/3-demethylubiquinone-9 3-methyltransferase